MKKQASFIAGLVFLGYTQIFGQSPQAFKYQTIARDNTGNIIPNKKVSFQMSILQGSVTGPVSYEETDTITTNAFGLANLAIGNGKVVSGNIASINWSNGPYYLQIEFDPTGGSSYTLMGTSQLLSVPYALYAQSAGGAWSLLGNAGTTPGNNFIGTTDANALQFKVNNTQAGYIDYNIATGNTGLGFDVLNANTGGYNTALGFQALWSNGAGNYNTAIGFHTLLFNTFSNRNTALGYEALYSQSFSTPFNTDNVAIGYDALWANQPTTTGNGNQNVAVGDFTLNNNTTGFFNTAIGTSALTNNVVGNFNTAVGTNALLSATSNDNTAVGEGALSNVTIQNNNTAIGWSAGPNSGALFNTTCLGVAATATASNEIVLGDAAVTEVGAYVAGITNLSDARFKTNIKENVPGLDFILKLKPVTYNLDVRKLNTFLGVKSNDDASMDKKAAITCSGFLAQDVELAAKDVNYDFDGVKKPANDKDHYGLVYDEFVVPLVKAVQEQQQIIDNMKKQNEEMLKRIEQLEKGKVVVEK